MMHCDERAAYSCFKLCPVLSEYSIRVLSIENVVKEFEKKRAGNNAAAH